MINSIEEYNNDGTQMYLMLSEGIINKTVADNNIGDMQNYAALVVCSKLIQRCQERIQLN